ncbi:MAG: FIVAR domain-containing protein, partial [Clostridia bacterium]|nr:FIVAR domain-containing protein [Clostridia bacterium]
MKRIISCFLLVTMMLASLLAVIPASAAVTEVNLMYGGLDPKGLFDKPGADAQFAGKGNVFYYDYWKYRDLQGLKDTDAHIPLEGNATGDSSWMLRFDTNNGTGTASLGDGIKHEGLMWHGIGTGMTIGSIEYGHVFGYSFKESVIADKVTLYIPAGTELAGNEGYTVDNSAYECPITSVDVYGASIDRANGIYGRESKKVLLKSFTDVKNPDNLGKDDLAKVYCLEAELDQALEIDYIFFALNKEGLGKYRFYEIELNGILAQKSNVADFNNNALKQQYNIYNEMLKADEYSEATWAAVANAVTETAAVNKNASATLEEITAAAATMKNAIDALVLKEGTTADKTKLTAALNAAQGKAEADYTPLTWAPFKAALDAANEANGKTNYGTTRLNKLADNLTAATNALLKKPDTSALTAKLNAAAALKKEEYTADSWAALETAIAEANTVIKNANATQDEVNTALTNLTTAIDGLTKPGNNEALKAEVEAAKKLNRDDFDVATALGWEMVQMEIENAEAVLANPEATQAEIDNALAQLKAQLATLIPKNQAGGDAGDASGDTTTTGSDSESEAPADGENGAP